LDDDATREDLLAYRYLIYKDKRELRRPRQELDARKERADASSCWRAELSSTRNRSLGAGVAGATASGAGNRNRRPSSRLDRIPEYERREITRDLDVSFMTYDSRENLHPATPQAAIVAAAAQTNLLTTQQDYGPRARTLIAGLNTVG
jgi:hypothetical protein